MRFKPKNNTIIMLVTYSQEKEKILDNPPTGKCASYIQILKNKINLNKKIKAW